MLDVLEKSRTFCGDFKRQKEGLRWRGHLQDVADYEN